MRAPLRVRLGGPLVHAVGGDATYEIEASTIRELLERLGNAHPELRPHLDRGVAVAVNGTVYRSAFLTVIPEDSEIYILPPIVGG